MVNFVNQLVHSFLLIEAVPGQVLVSLPHLFIIALVPLFLNSNMLDALEKLVHGHSLVHKLVHRGAQLEQDGV